MRLYDYVASGNCYKTRLLLAQLERSYERVAVDIFAGDTLAEDFAAKNPARTTPVLETDDGRYLQESNAILWYLADGTELLPDDPLDRAHVLREAGFDLDEFPVVSDWLRRVEATPGFMNDLEPYPPNADAGAGTSLY